MEMDATTVGFHLQTNLIIVDVEINGHTAAFLLDTGASATVLSERLARDLGIPKVRSQSGAGAGGNVETWMADVASIGVGDLRLGRSTCAIMSFDGLQQRIGPNVMGILGFDFLGRGVLTIDYPAQRITLRWPRNLEPAAVRVDGARLELPGERLAWTLPGRPWSATRDTPLANILAELRHPDGALVEIQIVRARGIAMQQALLSIHTSLEMQVEAFAPRTSEAIRRAGREAFRLTFAGSRDGAPRDYVAELILSPGGLVLVTASTPAGTGREVTQEIERFLTSALEVR